MEAMAMGPYSRRFLGSPISMAKSYTKGYQGVNPVESHVFGELNHLKSISWWFSWILCDCFGVLLSVRSLCLSSQHFRPYRTMPTMLRLLEWDTRPPWHVCSKRQQMNESSVHSAFTTFLASIYMEIQVDIGGYKMIEVICE